MNTVGSYRCECKEGFRKQDGNDEKVCIDINECNEMPGMCEQRCVNYWGSYRCACETGFRLADNNRTCEGLNSNSKLLVSCFSTFLTFISFSV